jgi:hypothetical protein
MFAMEMFPEVDKVIVEDLYAQCGNKSFLTHFHFVEFNRESLVEAIMSLQNGQNVFVG